MIYRFGDVNHTYFHNSCLLLASCYPCQNYEVGNPYNSRLAQIHVPQSSRTRVHGSTCMMGLKCISFSHGDLREGLSKCPKWSIHICITLVINMAKL